MMLKNWALISMLSPLLGAVLSGWAPRRAAHIMTISGVFVALVSSVVMAFLVFGGQTWSGDLYTWLSMGGIHFTVGLLVDTLSVLMALIVTLISFLVHIHSVGYMAGESGQSRFFALVSFFTFAMMTLVLSNNLLLMFFGWEGVGVASYGLIGFWFHKESACRGSFKAFVVNRVGDLGFLLGIAWVMKVVGDLHFSSLGISGSSVNGIALLLFVGAMGKSAQIPLHVWLPESMEGPTPISALIHAATMVTAGIFMMTRLSALFSGAHWASSLIMGVGATGALFLGLVGLVQNDIKRVVAYSTLSQLGYMVAACGAGLFSLAMFHLVTHAFFKALLFLGAGSVIIGMHHEQDMRKMGGLWSQMPWTYGCFLVGSLALMAIPPMSGFFSKDAIIQGVGLSHRWGAGYAHFCVTLGAMVTAMYSTRAFLMTFHGKNQAKAHETGWSMVLPLVVLAIPSVVSGWFLWPYVGLLGGGVPEESAGSLVKGAFSHLPFWLTLLGMVGTWWVYQYRQTVLVRLSRTWCYRVLQDQWGFDRLYGWMWVRPAQRLGDFFYEVGDQKVVDGKMVWGLVRWVLRMGRWIRPSQTGYVFHYILAIFVGLAVMVGRVMI